MKINYLFYFLLLSACNTPAKKTDAPSLLHKLADSVELEHKENLIVYSVNPNDCINCLKGFTEINRQLTQLQNSKLYVVLVEREIEKKELIRTTQTINFKDSINKVVLWDKTIYKNISAITGNKSLVSLLTIYNYKTDSIIFSRPIKEISSIDELTPFLLYNK